MCEKFDFLTKKIDNIDEVIFMYTNIEIEFKCKIDKETYDRLINQLDLLSRIFEQTNYYFDTPETSMLNRKLVLRIRKKSEDYFKITLKSQQEQETFERHVLITKEKAAELLEKGFSTKEYFEDFDYFVSHQATLKNYRASIVHEGGKLFLDKCEYNGQIDYEVEYEAIDYSKGLMIFNKFLETEKIPFVKSKKKSERAFGR